MKSFNELDIAEDSYIRNEPDLHSRILARVVAVVMLVWAILLVTPFFAPPASADSGCAGIYVDLSGPRLLDQDGADAGPWVDVEVPAGVYSVTLVSADPTHQDFIDPSQTDETWLLSTNSGTSVGPTSDISDSSVFSTTTFSSVAFDAAVSTVRAEHSRTGVNVNSVDPVSACFTALVEQEVVESEPEVPAEPDRAKTVVEPDFVEETPLKVVETPAPEVAELALTGPTTTLKGLLLGASLIALGALLIAAKEANDAVEFRGNLRTNRSF